MFLHAWRHPYRNTDKAPLDWSVEMARGMATSTQTRGHLDWSVVPLVLNQKPSPFGLVCAGRLGDINADKRSFGLVGDDGHVCISIYASEADQTNKTVFLRTGAQLAQHSFSREMADIRPHEHKFDKPH